MSFRGLIAHVLLLLINVALPGCTGLFMQPPIEGQLDCVQALAMIIKAAVSIHVRALVRMCVFNSLG